MPHLEAPSLILDTNVVLDWLVFLDPSCTRVGRAIQDGSVRWLATAAFRDELDAVLERGVGAARQPDISAIGRVWQQHALVLPPVPGLVGPRRCRCSDPDDQKFIDLALYSGAKWLLTRDRAVLKLAREASRSGLHIEVPSNWSWNPTNQAWHE